MINNALKYSSLIFFCLGALLCVPSATAGPVAEIGDIAVKFALINIWKGLGGLVLFIAGAYMLGNRRPFRYKIMAVAVAFLTFSITIIGILLFLGEFWPVLVSVAEKTADIIRYLF